MHRVLEYIDKHLDQELDLKALARVAHFSSFHFHRIFAAHVGETLGNYLTPTLLGGKNSQWFTEQIYTQFITRFNWEQGAAFGFLLLALSTALVVIGLRVSGQRFGDVMRRT